MKDHFALVPNEAGEKTIGQINAILLKDIPKIKMKNNHKQIRTPNKLLLEYQTRSSPKNKENFADLLFVEKVT